jgi:hypothetical protein
VVVVVCTGIVRHLLSRSGATITTKTRGAAKTHHHPTSDKKPCLEEENNFNRFPKPERRLFPSATTLIIIVQPRSEAVTKIAKVLQQHKLHSSKQDAKLKTTARIC